MQQVTPEDIANQVARDKASGVDPKAYNTGLEYDKWGRFVGRRRNGKLVDDDRLSKEDIRNIALEHKALFDLDKPEGWFDMMWRKYGCNK